MAVNGVYNIDDLANRVTQILKEYGNVSKKQVNEIAKNVAQRGAQKLRLTTTGEFKNVTGDYRRGWRAKKVKGKWIVHNITDYQLTHLLEDGHNRKGKPYAKAYPHIKDVEKELIEEYDREIREIFGG